jgi:hypothetical protein
MLASARRGSSAESVSGVDAGQAFEILAERLAGVDLGYAVQGQHQVQVLPGQRVGGLDPRVTLRIGGRSDGAHRVG